MKDLIDVKHKTREMKCKDYGRIKRCPSGPESGVIQIVKRERAPQWRPPRSVSLSRALYSEIAFQGGCVDVLIQSSFDIGSEGLGF